MKKIKTYIITLSILFVFAVTQTFADEADASREFQIKAAFLYNFLMFVDWPAEKMGDSKQPIIIGILGNDKFKDAFEPVKDKQVNGRNVVVKRFRGLEELKKSDKASQDKEIEDIKSCHLLYICMSEEKVLKEILDLIQGHSVLTVASMPKFVDSGGIIGFLVEEGKIRFEINDTVSEKAGLQIRSQLLRLAKRVIGGKSQEVKR